MRDLRFAAKCSEASRGRARQPPVLDTFSRTQLPCFLLVVLAW